MALTGSPRVVISGIGVVSPYGVGRECFWSQISRGHSATRPISEFDASPFPCTVAAPVPPLSIEDAPVIVARAAGNGSDGGHSDPRRYSRTALISVVAAREAWKDAGLRLNEPDAG